MWIYAILFQLNFIVAECGVTQEACVWESFEANCSGNKVLLIEKASFGRLRSGRCFNLTMDEKPCYADVQSFVERHCSGRKGCKIKLTNDNLRLSPSNCSIHLPKSLEVEYKCIDVYSSEKRLCFSNQSLLVTNSSGYLSNIVTDQTGQGSQLCPWRFQPRPGQTVHLTLLDFGVWVDRVERNKRSTCRIYAIIKEIEATNQTKDIVVCGGVEREKVIMSTDKEITITIMRQRNTGNDTAYFFIKYQVATIILTADPTIVLTADPSIVLTADPSIVLTEGSIIILASLAVSLVASLSLAAVIGCICRKRRKRASTREVASIPDVATSQHGNASDPFYAEVPRTVRAAMESKQGTTSRGPSVPANHDDQDSRQLNYFGDDGTEYMEVNAMGRHPMPVRLPTEPNVFSVVDVYASIDHTLSPPIPSRGK